MTESVRSYARVPAAASILAVLVGLSVLAGWTFDVSSLKSLNPHWVAMKGNTAAGFVLAGIALWVLRKSGPGRNRSGARIVAVVVGVLGLATLSEYVVGWDLRIDQLVFHEAVNAIGTSSPGRMASASALNFLLIGMALLLLDVDGPRGLRPAEPLAIVVAVIGVLAIVGYVHDVAPLTGFTRYTPLAAHTAIAFVGLAAGVLFARPDRGMMRVLTSPDAGGITARRLSLFIIATPLALGRLILEGERHALYESDFALALMSVSTMVVFSAIVWWNARSLNNTDVERRHAEEGLHGFFTLSLDMLAIASFDGYFKRLNPAWQRVLGFTNDELCARPYVDFIHPDDLAPTLAEAAKLAEEGVDTISFETAIAAATVRTAGSCGTPRRSPAERRSTRSPVTSRTGSARNPSSRSGTRR